MNRRTIWGILAGTVVSFGAQASAQELTSGQAIESLNLSELAATYSVEKTEAATHGESTSQGDALLIDMGVLMVEDLADPATVSMKLDHFVTDQLDLSEHYLGNVSDRNIVERIMMEWEESTVIQDEDVLATLNGLILSGYTTGYNVLNTDDLSNFDPNLLLRYGHSSIEHAVQLLYLMKSEGFDPKVQFIPKSSAFIFLPEWGEPPSSVVTFENGLMINVMVEYNIDFQFETTERRQAFMDLIDTFAKKDSADEPGLIIDSWWQPFYRSYTAMDRYEPISENILTIGKYQADLAALTETAAEMATQFRSVSEIDSVETVEVWVNPAFFRYMNGDFK